MPAYIVHLLDDHEQLRRSRRLEARTDADALRQAELFFNRDACEIWRDGRCIGRLEPNAGRARAEPAASRPAG